MNQWESRLVQARAEIVNAFVDALENGVEFARVLELLGVEGKPATMLRAMLSRYSNEQLAEMLQGAKITQSGDTAEVLPLRSSA